MQPTVTRKVAFSVAGESYTVETEKDFSIDRDDLDSELARQAAMFAWWAVLHEEARRERAEADAKLEALEYDRDRIERAKAAEAGAKTTEAAIKSAVRASPEWRKAEEVARRAGEAVNLTGAFRDAYAMRKDLLVSLARNRNFELSSPSAAEVEKLRQRFGRNA